MDMCLIVQARSAPVVVLNMEHKDHGGFVLSFTTLSGAELLQDKVCHGDASVQDQMKDLEKELGKTKLFTDVSWRQS